jgi:hypothetical protein
VRAITIKCPECGATINAAPGSPTTTCNYCGTTAQIQRRSPVLERPVQMSSAPVHVNMPVAVQRHSSRWLAITILVITLVAGGIPALCVFKAVKKQRAKLNAPHWSGTSGVLLADINGDGVKDMIGRLRIYKPSAMFFAAFDGRTGKRLWKSQRLGTYSDMLSTPSGLSGKALVVSLGGASLAGISVADGTMLWQIRLNEKTKKLCRGTDDNSIFVKTADKRFHRVALKDGALTAADSVARCELLPTDKSRDGASGDTITYKWSNDYRDKIPRDKIPGIEADTAIHHVPTKVTIALGHKKPGSRIPMIASYRWPAPKPEPAESSGEDPIAELRTQMRNARDPKERRRLMKAYMTARRAKRKRERERRERKPEALWTAQVPAIDPMTVREGDIDPKQADVNETAVVIAYQTKKSHDFRLTAFSVKDGKRLWDLALPGDRPLSAVAVSPTHAMVSRWSTLRVYDLKTGKPAFTID